MKYHLLLIIVACCLTSTITSAQYIGEIDTVGTTWYDYQHNGSCGRMIRVDSQGNIHVVWMNGLNSMGRHVYYNMHDSNGWRFGNVGIPVESSLRGGYSCLALDSHDIPYPAFHVVTSETNPDAQAACARDSYYGAGDFDYWECPFIYCPERLELLWPKIAIDIDDRIHIVNTENPQMGNGETPCASIMSAGNTIPLLWKLIGTIPKS